MLPKLGVEIEEFQTYSNGRVLISITDLAEWIDTRSIEIPQEQIEKIKAYINSL